MTILSFYHLLSILHSTIAALVEVSKMSLAWLKIWPTKSKIEMLWKCGQKKCLDWILRVKSWTNLPINKLILIFNILFYYFIIVKSWYYPSLCCFLTFIDYYSLSFTIRNFIIPFNILFCGQTKLFSIFFFDNLPWLIIIFTIR